MCGLIMPTASAATVSGKGLAMTDNQAMFQLGQVILHRLFGYRGVIVDVDPAYLGTDEWYEEMAQSSPPKDKPWYRVLVHDAEHTTYVSERNLAPDDGEQPVEHPDIATHFARYENGAYIPLRLAN